MKLWLVKDEDYILILLADISEKKKAQMHMMHSNKMTSLGEMASGIAHEINNPLAGMMQNAQVIYSRLTKDLPENHRVAQELGISMKIIKEFMILF